MTEIERLQDAKRRALAIADERAKENVRLRAERDLLVRALESASIQCGNVIFNCEQKPADNRRHLDSWCSVKAFIDTALRNAHVGGSQK
jgi:hypothetical protein